VWLSHAKKRSQTSEQESRVGVSEVPAAQESEDELLSEAPPAQDWECGGDLTFFQVQD